MGSLRSSALAALLLLAPAVAAADSFPQDPYYPCLEQQSGSACGLAGCTCVDVPLAQCQAAGWNVDTCRECRHPDQTACWVPYHPSDPGGCGIGTPALVSLGGAAGVLLLAAWRRRRA